MTDTSYAWKIVHPDGCTSHGFRWPLVAGGECRSDHNPVRGDHLCPRRPGDGLTVAHTASGMASGNIASPTLLVVSYSQEDVAAEDAYKARILGPVTVVQVIDWYGALRLGGGPKVPLDLDPLWGRDADLAGADLRYANLSRADLRGAYLRYANLLYANLGGAGLQNANLREVHLRYANLWYADLQNANLLYASLRYANLESADLQDADLRDADLRDANLRKADLRGAYLENADLWMADLRGADLTGALLPDGYEEAVRL